MPEEQAWLRRHAVQIAAQLPENPADALVVLDFARLLVVEFLSPVHDLADRAVGGDVLAFPAAASSRCSASGNPLSIPK